MYAALAGLGIGLLAYGWWRWRIPRTSIDKSHWEEYDAVSANEAAPTPFRLRWLLPSLLGTKVKHWNTANAIFMVLSVPLLGIMAKQAGLAWPWQIAAMLAWGVFPSYWERTLRFPKTMEAVNMVFLMSGIVTIQAGYPIWSLPLALLAGATRETSPLVMAAATWSPWPIFGMLGAGWWRPQCEPWRDEHLFGSPIKLFKDHGVNKLKTGIPLDWVFKLGPAMLGLATTNLKVWTTMLVASGPLFVASDKIRLLVPAVPVLLISALGIIPLSGLPLFCLLALACANTWETYKENR